MNRLIMRYAASGVLVFLGSASTSAVAELTALEDDALSTVSARAGLTLALESATSLAPATGTNNQYLQADDITWSAADQNGGSQLTFENVGVGQADGGSANVSSIYTVDVDQTTGLNIGLSQERRRLTINDIRLGSNYIDTSSPETDFQKGLGALLVDYRIGGVSYVVSSSSYDFSGNALIQITPVPGSSGVRLRGNIGVQGADIIYQDKQNRAGDDSHDLIVQNVNAGLLLDQPGSSLDVNVLEDDDGDYIRFGFTDAYSALSMGGLRIETYESGTQNSLGWGEQCGIV